MQIGWLKKVKIELKEGPYYFAFDEADRDGVLWCTIGKMTGTKRTPCRAVVRAGSDVIPKLFRNNFERATKMADFNVSEAIDSIQNSELKKLLLQFFIKLSAKDERILALENRVAELEERVDECEKYSSKDCRIFENLPIKKPEGNVPTLEHQVCDFLLKYLSWDTYPHNFKVCSGQLENWISATSHNC